MAIDIYDLNKGGNKRLVTSHDAMTFVRVGGADLRLIQQAQLQYNQRTEARFEVGFEHIFWACGQSQGTLTMNKLVGQQSIQGPVGVWDGMDTQMRDPNKTAAVPWVMSTPNGVTRGDGVFQQASMSFNVGDMAIQDNAVMSVGQVTHP